MLLDDRNSGKEQFDCDGGINSDQNAEHPLDGVYLAFQTSALSINLAFQSRDIFLCCDGARHKIGERLNLLAGESGIFKFECRVCHGLTLSRLLIIFQHPRDPSS